ncbi:aromatic ring-hydroxylating oxygenase subunit alpha [Acrocarpospora catenulata]|uniref:aromatic ring-hydroxylating oxygenase subunit alpha n=1 Tax=Acrocarpospora catenulata TaxID=2836182 RepID=UPI001BDAC3B4|nr:aromatic ring-hydroxylating dioxygenase subunit alpha [Acrocarpospora catenulata]
MDTVLDDKIRARAAEILLDVERCTDPVQSAQLLPRQVYTSQDFFEFEKQAIFGREWLCVAHVNEIPSPGDQLPMTIFDEPIVVLRDLSGEIRTLSTVCQHRGHPIFDGLNARDAEAPCLNGTKLVCPYHNWAFGLDGKLVAAPQMTETVPLKDLRRFVRLPAVRTEIFHGLVFVNFDPDARPLAPTLAKLDAELATFGLDELVPMPASMRRDLPWNWKIHHDNALEPYHTAFVHKGVHESAPSRLAEFGEFEPGDGQIMHPTYLVSEEASLGDAADGRRRTPGIPGLTEEQRRRVMFASVPPLIFGIFQPTFVSLSFVLPTSARTIDLRRVNLYPKSAVEVPGFEEIYAEQLKRKAVAIEQDAVTTEALQRGYESRFAPRGPLAKLETTIPQMNAWLLTRYQAALGATGG